MKKSYCILFFLGLLLLSSCSEDAPEKRLTEANLATSWADLTLSTIFATPPNSPTYTSRSLGYLGLTMYESVVHGSATHNSIAPELNGLSGLPLPEPGNDYNWYLALNAGQAHLLKLLYNHASADVMQQIDQLEANGLAKFSENTEITTVNRSVAFGKAVASAIFEWAKTDGGHLGYQRNFDPDYIFPVGPGYWIPPAFGQSASTYPLHPYWGSNRTFLTKNSGLPVPQMLTYSTDPGSEYYNQFQQVHNKVKSLTQTEKNIAAWWADDPTQTSSPPGHSYNLATACIKKVGANLFTASQVYAKVGIAVADAFINCWKCKYTYHAERPYAYIVIFIDNSYTQFWPEPPFPAFSSGHATQSAAAANVLESVFGTDFSVVDDTYENRASDFPEISYSPRLFNSIWETAEECANSRFYGGIHTPHDNEQGQLQGIAIGENISSLGWNK